MLSNQNILTTVDGNNPFIASTHPMADVSGTSQLVALWLHDKTPQSQKSYEADIRYFVGFLLGQDRNQVRLNDLDLRTVTLNDVQAYSDYLEVKGLASATRRRKLAALRSLLKFGQEVDFLRVNVGCKVKLPKRKNDLAQRILSEIQIATMIALTTKVRDKLIIRLLYATGARVGEVELLTWNDIRPNRDGRGQVSLFGKGEKTRTVLIPKQLYDDLVAFSGSCKPDSPVFVSRKFKQPLKHRQIENIVSEAGQRAGIAGKVSPHWLRHSHASHSLDRGCPPQLLQHSLGHQSLDTTSKYAHARPNDSSSLYVMPV